MSYIVQNLTKSTIILSDLRAEIGPQKMLDLEKIADRGRIDRSHDLIAALRISKLKLLSHSVARKLDPLPVIERIIEKHHHHDQAEVNIDEEKIALMVAKMLKESQPVIQKQSNIDSDEILKAMSDLKNQIATMGGEKQEEISTVDPELLANLQSKAIAKLSENVKSGNVKSGKKVILKNTNLKDLANELD